MHAFLTGGAAASAARGPRPPANAGEIMSADRVPCIQLQSTNACVSTGVSGGRGRILLGHLERLDHVETREALHDLRGGRRGGDAVKVGAVNVAVREVRGGERRDGAN